MISRRRFLASSLGASTCMLLAACSGSAPPAAPATTAPAPAAKPTSAPAATPAAPAPAATAPQPTTAPKPQSTQAAPAAKAGLPPIRVIGGNAALWSTQLPMIVGIHAGFLKDVGFSSVDWKLAGNDGPSLAALISGSGDFTEGTGTQSVIQLANKGEKIFIVGSVSNRIPLSLVSAKEITAISQLKGKKVGANTEPYPVDTYLAKALAQGGLTLDDIEIVRLGADPERYAALQNGLTDAIMAGTLILAPAADAGYHRLVDVGDLFPDYLQRTFTVNGDFLAQHPDAVDAFMLAMVKSQTWVHDPANVPKIKEFLDADGFKNDPKYIDAFIQEAIRLIPPSASPTQAGTQLVLDEMKDQAPNVTFASLMRLDSVHKADQQLGQAYS